MLEAQPKAALVKLARQSMQGFVVIRHEEHFTHGVPDISITGMRTTSWYEVKLADPEFTSQGIQDLTMLRLASSGFAAYHIIYAMDKDETNKRVHLVKPKNLAKWETEAIVAPGFNHHFVLDFIWRIHKGEIR